MACGTDETSSRLALRRSTRAPALIRSLKTVPIAEMRWYSGEPKNASLNCFVVDSPWYSRVTSKLAGSASVAPM